MLGDVVGKYDVIMKEMMNKVLNKVSASELSNDLTYTLKTYEQSYFKLDAKGRTVKDSLGFPVKKRITIILKER